LDWCKSQFVSEHENRERRDLARRGLSGSVRLEA
jgi:hypothetical protein